MAFTTSDLAAAQVKLLQKAASAEMRKPYNGTLLTYLNGGKNFIQDYEALRTREDRTVTAYFKNRTKRAAGSAISHNHTGTHGTSTAYTPTWTASTDVFAITLKQGDKNVFERQEMLVNEIMNVQMNITTDLEQKAVDHAFANRTTANSISVEGAFNPTKDAFEVTAASNGDRFAQIIESVMFLNDYTGSKTYLCDTIAYNKFKFQMAQGIYNSTNLSFQFGNDTFVHSPGLNAKAATLTYTKGMVIAVEDGLIGGMPWIGAQNRAGVTTTVNSYSTMINPLDGIMNGVHVYEQRANGTSVGGYLQDVLTEVQMHTYMSFDAAPLSTAGETALYAFALI